MATIYVEYRARLPKKFEWEARALLGFLREHRALGERGEFFVFHIVDNDDGYGIRLGTISHHLPHNEQVHGCNRAYDGRHATLLQELLDKNRIELVEVDTFCSGWYGNDDEESFDFEELVGSIPTLVLQEVLARRLSAEPSSR